MAGGWLSLAGAAVDAVGAGLTAAQRQSTDAGGRTCGEVVTDCHRLGREKYGAYKIFLKKFTKCHHVARF